MNNKSKVLWKAMIEDNQQQINSININKKLKMLETMMKKIKEKY